jgi:hypothetical protein
VHRHGPSPAAQRGAIFVESAIVTAFVLTLVLGMIEMGLLGFLQITVDAGAFLNAHQNVVGVTDPLGPADATHEVFPQIQTTAITNSVQTAPSPTVPVDYGYNGTAAEQQAAPTHRHGGASLLQPYLSQTSITQVPFTFLGIPFRVHSQAREVDWLESNVTWDASNANYGDPYAAGNNAQNANVFTEGENVPLYYMSLDFVYHCATSGAWGASPKGVCPNQDTLSLGTGEFLDNLNWSNGTAGVGGPVNSTGPGGTTGTFEAAACHQRMFATLAYFFENLAQNNYGNSAGFAADPLNYIETTYNPYWYNGAGSTGYSNFQASNVSFFGQYAGGALNSGTSHYLDTQATQAVRTIYSWDVEHFQGQGGQGGIGNNPLHPTAGCT